MTTAPNLPTPVPERSILLHVGPHKTGTTAIQSAFHRNRRGLEEQGVHYAGKQRQPMQAVHALTGRASPYADGGIPPMRHWKALVGEVRRSQADRVAISSEGFADADEAAVRRAITDLDRGRVHVVVTLRPLVDLLPSQWQQQLQSGLTMPFESWLEAVFDQPQERVSRTFWQRHRHDELIRRWASAVGEANVTAIVGDPSDRDGLLRTFEALLALRGGTLVPEPDLANRSLTDAEAEAVRAFNVAFRAEGLGTPVHAKVMRFGAAELMKRRDPSPDEPRIRTPAWAVGRASEAAAEIAAGIRASGIRVIGDLANLTPKPPASRPPTAGQRRAAEEARPKIGATMALGVVLASGLARGGSASEAIAASWPDGRAERVTPPPRARVEPLELARVSTPLLGFVLVRRLLGAARTGIPRPRRGS